MKFHKSIIFFTSVLFLFSCSNKQPKIEFLTNDIHLSENLNGKNLNGHTVSISKNGLVLSNLFNGNITILEKAGAGTVTIKNSSIEVLTVESKSTIILDSTTSIKKLIIHDNAKITSTKTLEKKYSKRKDKNPENYSTQQPVIETVEIDYGITPLFEGGKIENIVKLDKTETPAKKDKPAEVVISNQSEAIIQKIESSESEKKLYLVQDKTYKGDGVKIDIINRPENSGYLQIYKTNSRHSTEQIAWYTEHAFWDPEQIERYFRDSFTYEYLNAGEVYTFVVNYYKESKIKNNYTLVDSYSIAVVPEYGSELFIDKNDISISIDSETGLAKWNKAPVINVKKGAVITYSLQWGNWKYFGHLRRYADSASVYDPINIYKDMSYIDPTAFKNENVFLHVGYDYKGYSWNIYQSEPFDYDISKTTISD